MRVPFVDLSRLVSRLRDDVMGAWSEHLDACDFVGGPSISALESKLAATVGAPHVTSCSCGSDALLVALRAAGVRAGTRVALPNLTFWATFEAIVQLGAVPVLVDVDPDDLQMSLDELRAAHDAHRVGAVLLVHLFGWTSGRLAELRAWCRETEVPLVEDGAQAFGVEVMGEPLFASSELATLSFYPAKVLGGAMDGGAVVSAHPHVDSLVRELCNHGRTGHYEHGHVGWNARMSVMQALYLSRALDELPHVLASRRAASAWYRARFAGDPRVRTFAPPAGVVDNGYLQVLTLPGRDALSLVEALRADGIGASRTYPATLDAQPGVIGTGTIAHGDLRWSRAFCREVINLPLFFGIRHDELEACAQALLDALGRH